MSTLLAIGEFSRLTHLSVKALRHYDDVHLLEPTAVDPASGYRRYSVAQVPAAHLIRRFRDLDMPIDHIRVVLGASEPAERDRVLVAHLERMEAKLDETAAAVASLRGLLDGTGADLVVERRRIDPVSVLSVAEEVAWDDTEAWLEDAFGELAGVLARGDHARQGPDGALYPEAFFHAHAGDLVAFVPASGPVVRSARVVTIELPAVDMAVTVHHGPFSEIDTTYGALGTYVGERVIGATGPIREHYLVSDEPDRAETEVCWPIRDADRAAHP